MIDEFIQFEKGKPFYEMVGSFILALSACPAMFNTGNPMSLGKSDYISINGVQVDDKHWLPSAVYEQAQAGHATKENFVGHLCMMLANLTYETVKAQNDKSPEFEFLRHVRNAASHNNKFFFRDSEPRRPACWRGLSLDHTIKGTNNPMFDNICFGPTLGPADLLELLRDVEKRIAP